MFEESFYRIGLRIGALQTRLMVVLAVALLAVVLVIGAGAYVWFNPTALCRTQATSLYFGTTIGSDGRVTSQDWDHFVDEVIVPRFPDGFTLTEGRGAWRSSPDGVTMREATHIFMVVHPQSADIDTRLSAIAEDYKARFRQQSVLRLDQCGTYSF